MSSRSFTTSAITVGSIRCTLICDVMFSCPNDFVVAESLREEWINLLGSAETGAVTLPVNCLLIETGDRRIVVDAGDGHRAKRPAEENGELLAELERLGIGADDVDTVVISHPHADHINGMLAESDGGLVPVFKNARHVVSKIDHDDILENESNPRLPEALAFYYDMTREAYLVLNEAGLVDPVAEDATVAPGVRLLHTPGHTRGHVAVVVEDAGETLIFLADAYHFEFEFSHPHLFCDFDNDHDAVVASKHMARELALETNAIVSASHFVEPFSRLTRTGERSAEVEPVRVGAP